jgi:hypothetical protein
LLAIGTQVLFEVLVERLHVQLIRRILQLSKLRGIQQGDQVVLEVSGILPLTLEP